MRFLRGQVLRRNEGILTRLHNLGQQDAEDRRRLGSPSISKQMEQRAITKQVGHDSTVAGMLFTEQRSGTRRH